jgi:demethoxyubiquinone hydroxylase (CLK1/Coq7/Cat5 family)
LLEDEDFPGRTLIRHFEKQINTIDRAQKELQQNIKHLLEDEEDFLKSCTASRNPSVSASWRIS